MRIKIEKEPPEDISPIKLWENKFGDTQITFPVDSSSDCLYLFDLNSGSFMGYIREQELEESGFKLAPPLVLRWE